MQRLPLIPPEPEPEIMSPDARRTLESLGRCGPIWRILMHPDISAELEGLGAIRASSLPLAPPWRGDALAWELTPEGCEFLGISYATHRWGIKVVPA